MDSPFIFTQPVVGDSFVGRKDELAWLSSNLSNGQHTVLIAPPVSGKQSLVTNALIQAQKQQVFRYCTLPLFNVRDEFSFYASLAESLLRAVCDTSDEWETAVQSLLPETRPQVNIKEMRQNEITLLFEESRVMEHSAELLHFPERLAGWKNVRLIVGIYDFQNIEHFDETAAFQKRLAATWKQHAQVGYLLCGNRKNAMRVLFGEKKPFHKFGDVISFGSLDEKLTIDYIVKSFSKSGRVISKEFSEQIYHIVSGYPYYVQLMAHLCWLNTRGFVIESVINKSLEDLYDFNERVFRRTTDVLSDSQLNYLRAMIDGIDRFSAAETLALYKLHSSANVARVREALEKKEILEFGKNNKPSFIDPVFEMWFRRRYMNN